MHDQTIAADQPISFGSISVALLAWLWRLCVAVAMMLIWLVQLGFILTYLLPASTLGGVFSSFSIRTILGLVTAFYYCALAPMLILPLDEQQRFRWFLHAAYGWVACMIGTVAILNYQGVIEIGEFPANFPPVAAALAVAVVILVTFFSASYIPSSSKRIPTALTLLVLIGLVAECLCFARADIASPNERIATVGFVLLAAICIVSFVVPRPESRNSEISGVLLLSWASAVVAALCYQMMYGGMATIGGDGRHEFQCLVASLLFAPFVGWLGMPGFSKSKFAWCICLLVAYGIVIYSTFVYDCEDGRSIVTHVWERYDGPHLWIRAADHPWLTE